MGIAKRSVFLINPRFQLRFSFILAGVVFLASLVYPLVFVDFLEAFASRTDANSSEAFSDLLILLVPIQLLSSAVIFFLCIFMTHTIAGPLYKLKAHLSQIREGEAAVSDLKFRRWDEFHDVAEEVSLFLDEMVKNREADYLYLEEVVVYIKNLSHVIPEDKRPVLREISRRLTEILEGRKKAS